MSRTEMARTKIYRALDASRSQSDWLRQQGPQDSTLIEGIDADHLDCGRGLCPRWYS